MVASDRSPDCIEFAGAPIVGCWLHELTQFQWVAHVIAIGIMPATAKRRYFPRPEHHLCRQPPSLFALGLKVL